MATFNNNFKVKNGLDASGNISTTAGLVSGTDVLPANMQAYLLSTLTTNVGLSVRGASGQTANLAEFQTNTGSIIGRISVSGAAVFSGVGVFGAQTNPVNGQLYVQNSSASNPGAVIRGASGQTANLFEWQNNTPSTIALVTSGGSIFSSANGGFGATSALGTARLSVSAASSSVGIIVRGNATTPGNLQEWQTSTPTTVASISSSGNFSTSGGITISGANSPIVIGSNHGTSGQVLTSQGTANTPTWTTVSGGTFTGGNLTSGLVLAAGTTSLQPLKYVAGTNLTTPVTGVKEYDGTVFYQTSNTNPGRALSTQNYYYVSSSDYIVDFSGSGAVQSVLGAATRGINVSSGTTYEYELSMTVRDQFFVETGITGTFQLTSTTVSGSPSVSHISYVDYGSNTTGFTTATTMSSVRTTGNVTFSASIASGSRYSILKAKGIIRVVGSGVAEIYPGLLTSSTNQHTWTVSSGLVFKLTPIGDGTVTSVGAWV